VETINATIYKDSLDIKVGLTVVATGEKVYVDSLSGLFATTGEKKRTLRYMLGIQKNIYRYGRYSV